jgi:hypothetical protein
MAAFHCKVIYTAHTAAIVRNWKKIYYYLLVLQYNNSIRVKLVLLPVALSAITALKPHMNTELNELGTIRVLMTLIFSENEYPHPAISQ